jgi:hypothetical protein
MFRGNSSRHFAFLAPILARTEYEQGKGDQRADEQCLIQFNGGLVHRHGPLIGKHVDCIHKIESHKREGENDAQVTNREAVANHKAPGIGEGHDVSTKISENSVQNVTDPA